MFGSPRSRRALVLAPLAAVALSACNPVLVPLAGETRIPSCVSGNPFGPLRYEGPNNAALDIFVSSPDDPALAGRSLQVALGYDGTPPDAANAVRVGDGRHTDYSILANGQTVSVEVCSADGTPVGGYVYNVIVQTRGRHSQDLVGRLIGTDR